MKYTKFITLFLDDIDDEEKGFYNAALYLNEFGILSEEKKKKLENNLKWIDSNLNKRPDFNQNQDEFSLDIPMTWLKGNASEHIIRMNEIKDIMEENDILVEVLETDDLGTILYEDEFQVVALPMIAMPI